MSRYYRLNNNNISYAILKCERCNIVINEVLAFVQNKIEVMDHESLLKICCTSFSATDISEAKDLLYLAIPAAKRKISRRKDGINQKNMEDIISIFHSTDPEGIPIFVAKDLYKLPPLTFDHIDATRLLKDILILQSEVQKIKEHYVSTEQLNELKKSYELNHINTRNEFVNKKRGGSCFYDSSGPMGLLSNCSQLPVVNNSQTKEHFQFPPSSSSPDKSAVSNVTLTRDLTLSDLSKNNIDRCVQLPAPADGIVDVSQASNQSASVRQAELGLSLSNQQPARGFVDVYIANGERDIGAGDLKQQQHSFADIVVNGNARDKNDGWTLVQKKRRSDRFTMMSGKAEILPDNKFKAADSVTTLFISNVNKDTSSEDIVQYVKGKYSKDVKVDMISMKKSRNYNAFRLNVNKCDQHIFLNDDFWPENVTYRRYVYFRDNKKFQK